MALFARIFHSWDGRIWILRPIDFFIIFLAIKIAWFATLRVEIFNDFIIMNYDLPFRKGTRVPIFYEFSECDRATLIPPKTTTLSRIQLINFLLSFLKTQDFLV